MFIQVSVRTPTGVITSHVRLLVCTVDLPAKTSVMNMNGKCGYSYCEDEGTPRAASHLQRNWLYSEESTPRTHKSIVNNAKEAVRKDEPEVKVIAMVLVFTTNLRIFSIWASREQAFFVCTSPLV